VDIGKFVLFSLAKKNQKPYAKKMLSTRQAVDGSKNKFAKEFIEIN